MLMILFNYKKLFSIEIMHAYYRSRYSDDLVFLPDTPSQSLLQGLGLRFREHTAGFSIFADTNQQNELKKNLPSTLKLTFLVFLKNPYFINFSAIRYNNEPQKAFYFNNRQVNKKDVFSQVMMSFS